VDLGAADVALGAEVDARLDDCDVDTLADDGQVATDSLELARWHLHDTAKIVTDNKFY